jgi:hypothetical protein
MGIFRLLIIFIIAYIAMRLLRRLFAPGKENPQVHGKSKQNGIRKNKKDIEDADYEEIE